MIKRELKYYRWSYENGKITLLEKKTGKEMTILMAMADSFVRGYISFKNKNRIEQTKKAHDKIKKTLEKKVEHLQAKVEKLSSRKEKKNDQPQED